MKVLFMHEGCEKMDVLARAMAVKDCSTNLRFIFPTKILVNDKSGEQSDQVAEPE